MIWLLVTQVITLSMLNVYSHWWYVMWIVSFGLLLACVAFDFTFRNPNFPLFYSLTHRKSSSFPSGSTPVGGNGPAPTPANNNNNHLASSAPVPNRSVAPGSNPEDRFSSEHETQV